MINDIIQHSRSIYEYEDEERSKKAIAVIPFEEILAKAEREPSEGEPGWGYSENDRFIIFLLKWFKGWFKWVNAPECISCGSDKAMVNIGNRQPTPEEAKYGASTVEAWACSQCKDTNGNMSITRFPRYNDCVKLLSYRKGRCGEWANVMQLLLRAIGRPARYVWNTEDHVWNEVWSKDQERWIHVDSCEAAFDTPLLYTDGWGKKMAYIIGFSVEGIKDITPRYVRRHEMALPRTAIPEEKSAEALTYFSTGMRDKLDPSDTIKWHEYSLEEDNELASYGGSAIFQENSPARESGSKTWTRQRGEGGSGRCQIA